MEIPIRDITRLADGLAGMDRRPRAQNPLDTDTLVDLAANFHRSSETGGNTRMVTVDKGQPTHALNVSLALRFELRDVHRTNWKFPGAAAD
jgi:hypothetical protein